jgi:hypothetical protein
MADPPSVACTNCGKNMTLDDLRRPNCSHCGQLLAHHARAAQQVAVINQMMVDSNGNGIPDAFEGLAANATRNAYGQMGQNMGIGAANGMAVGQALGGVSNAIHGPNPYGNPGGAIGQVQMMPGGGYGYVPNQNYQVNAMNNAMQGAAKATAFSMVAEFIIIGAVLVLTIAGGVLAFLMTAR